MPEISFSRFYRYDELTELLRAYAAEYPNFVEVEAIGKSYEGRDIWLVTVTNKATKAHSEKPAFWVEGNIHATEVSGSTAALRVLDQLLTNPAHAPLLDSRTFYIVPRVNPDGAEWALESPPRAVRSSTRPYPYDEEDPEGLERQDLDGDGRVLNMRIKDANGPWKVCEQETRLLVRREPGESGGEYYRLLPEGLLHNWDGLTLRPRKAKQGLDMNRNYPHEWRGEHEQYGAGPFPTSEPEVHAAVNAIVSRPNICGGVTFHTYGGLLLRPPSTKPDTDLAAEDVWTYQAIGKKGTDLSGYPNISVYHDFRYHPKEVITGVFDDWMFEARGVFAWTTEIWCPQRQAGITDMKPIDWYREHSIEDDLKMLKWSDEKLEGKGYIDWYEFEHPQLGKVELGGWDSLYAFRNPPPQFLEAEVTPLAEWVIWQAGCSPCLEQRDLRIEKVAAGWKVRLAVQNTGWLPTSVTQHAAAKKLVRGVVGEITKVGTAIEPNGAAQPSWLVSGGLRQVHGQLRGWNQIPSAGFGWHADPTDDVAVLEWILAEPGTYEAVAKHERAGLVRVRFELA